MTSRVQATPMRALQERSALSRSQRRGSTVESEDTPSLPANVASAKQVKRSTRKEAAPKNTYDRWGLDLSHFDHIKGVKASELRNIETWCFLSHDGLLNERRERFLSFINASFEHAQLAYCCYFWEEMMGEIKDLHVTLHVDCVDSGNPKAEHLEADLLHGLAHTVGLARGDIISPQYFEKIPALEATQVAAEQGHLRFKLVPSNTIVPVTMPHAATLTGPPGLTSTDEATRNAQLLDQNREILENMKAQQIQCTSPFSAPQRQCTSLIAYLKLKKPLQLHQS
eukprot:SAG11_NODE_4069_length_2053_cov_2.867172_2_plen_283_part_00